jgi:hypothetical protein
MKDKFYRKILVFGLIGLFLFTTINPAIALVNDKLQENKISTKSAPSYTYNIKETYIWGIIENQTNVKYDSVFIRNDNSFGIFKDISVKGNTRELHIVLFPLLANYFKIFQNGIFAILNRNITLEIKLLLRGNIYDEPDSFWFVGRALGVTLTIEG